jgi:hypothetical protein
MLRSIPCQRRSFVRHRLRTCGGRRLHGAIDEGRAMLADIYNSLASLEKMVSLRGWHESQHWHWRRRVGSQA